MLFFRDRLSVLVVSLTCFCVSCEGEREAFFQAEEINTVDAYAKFLAEYPKGEYSSEALELQEKAAAAAAQAAEEKAEKDALAFFDSKREQLLPPLKVCSDKLAEKAAQAKKKSDEATDRFYDSTTRIQDTIDRLMNLPPRKWGREKKKMKLEEAKQRVAQNDQLAAKRELEAARREAMNCRAGVLSTIDNELKAGGPPRHVVEKAWGKWIASVQ